MEKTSGEIVKISGEIVKISGEIVKISGEIVKTSGEIVDITKMSKKQKYDYIFEKDINYNNEIRFEWINNCLLGDIRTFLDGIENVVHNEYYQDTDHRGGGNLSVPIIFTTAIELISALYCGKTEYKDGKNIYNAADNVKNFMEFFPINYKKISSLLWGGIRDGTHHVFYPKAWRLNNIYVRFMFYVEDKNIPSAVVKIDDTILIKINDFELYDLLKNSIKIYRMKLESDESLQNNFILAFNSIVEYIKEIKSSSPQEDAINFLLSKFGTNDSYSLLEK